MRALILAATMLATTPAFAQHGDHTGHATPEPVPVDPHTGRDMPESDSMDMPMGTPTEDPHAGHSMPAPPATDPHAGHNMSGTTPPDIPASGPPPEAFSGPEYAADTVFDPAELAGAREELRRGVGGFVTQGFFVDRLESQIGDGADGYLWDINAWHGGDTDKLWIKSEGEGAFGGELEDAEVQALWSHAIAPFFDLQAGVRYDLRPEPDRAHIVLGIQGLAPYFFELDVATFLSNEGDLTARIEAEYEQRITQRLILQPRVEASFAAQNIPEIGIGAGLSAFEAGLRLRYEFVPEFAPYIGIEWQQMIGDTADFARATGEDPGRVVFLTGVRIWF